MDSRQWNGFPFNNFTSATNSIADGVVAGHREAAKQLLETVRVSHNRDIKANIQKRQIARLKQDKWLDDAILYNVARVIGYGTRHAIVQGWFSRNMIEGDYTKAFDGLIAASKSAATGLITVDKVTRKARFSGDSIIFVLHVNTNHWMLGQYIPAKEGWVMKQYEGEQADKCPKVIMYDSFHDVTEEARWCDAIRKFLAYANLVSNWRHPRRVYDHSVTKQYVQVDANNCGAFTIATLFALANNTSPCTAQAVCDSLELSRLSRKYMACVLAEGHAGRNPLMISID